MYIFHVNQCNDVHDTLAYAHMSEPYMLSLKYYWWQFELQVCRERVKPWHGDPCRSGGECEGNFEGGRSWREVCEVRPQRPEGVGEVGSLLQAADPQPPCGLPSHQQGWERREWRWRSWAAGPNLLCRICPGQGQRYRSGSVQFSGAHLEPHPGEPSPRVLGLNGHQPDQGVEPGWQPYQLCDEALRPGGGAQQREGLCQWEALKGDALPTRSTVPWCCGVRVPVEGVVEACDDTASRAAYNGAASGQRDAGKRWARTPAPSSLAFDLGDTIPGGQCGFSESEANRLPRSFSTSAEDFATSLQLCLEGKWRDDSMVGAGNWSICQGSCIIDQDPRVWNMGSLVTGCQGDDAVFAVPPCYGHSPTCAKQNIFFIII